MGVDIIYCYGRGPAPSSTESLLVSFIVAVETDSSAITSDEHKAIERGLWRKSVISIARSSCSEAASILGDDADFSASGPCDVSNSESKSCVLYQGAVTVVYSTESPHPTTEEMTANALNGINRAVINGDFLEGMKTSIETISNKAITGVEYFERNDYKEQSNFAAEMTNGNFAVAKGSGFTHLAIGMIAFACVMCALLFVVLSLLFRRKRSSNKGKSIDKTGESTLPIENQHYAKNIPIDDEDVPHEDFEMLYVSRK